VRCPSFSWSPRTFTTQRAPAENPGDKLLPAPATIAATIHRFALEEDERSGEYLLWERYPRQFERL